jgi:alpha-amylase/alpha-mannosidase (GH57 family)
MSQIYLCFLWHMHQPFYKDLVTGEYKLPWTRMHALKDYYGMVRMLEDFPRVRQTFNLVPSMMVQVAEYAAGEARDPFLEVALKPAEDLTEVEQEFLLANSFHAHPPRMIYRYPRYGEIYEAWRAQKGRTGTRRYFSTREVRDVQVLSQLAWFDEEFLERDSDVIALIRKERDFSAADQQLMGAKQREILGKVVPAYKRLASTGQIEVSTTPYYHPILPLICDTDIAAASHPGVPLPPRFRHPQDARRQLEMARDFVARVFGAPPAGLWPSEGSVSDEVFHLSVETGFRWAATDSGVLARTLGRGVGVDAIYRPYRWRQASHELNVIFRDHFLSDLIGFVYSGMETRTAADDFLRRIRENCQPILAAGRDALVPIILDGENAWEYYERNGRPFLRELYRLISEDPRMIATTVSDALSRLPADPLDHIFPGSWINANFDVWIGAEEDNQAWTHLLRARETYDTTGDAPLDKKLFAYEELLIAEGSDWNWWYGPEHQSANRPEFDQLYRSHLANVYRFLGKTPPEELSRPILRSAAREFHLDPTGPVRPQIDGLVTSYFEWIGAGSYRVDARSGSMHGKQFFVHEVHYGTDGASLFLRLDFLPGFEERANGMETRLKMEAPDASHPSSAVLRFDGARVGPTELRLAKPQENDFECAYSKILEFRVSLDALGAKAGTPVRFQFSIWQDGLPVDAVPQQGWLEIPSTDPSAWSQ